MITNIQVVGLLAVLLAGICLGVDSFILQPLRWWRHRKDVKAKGLAPDGPTWDGVRSKDAEAVSDLADALVGSYKLLRSEYRHDIAFTLWTAVVMAYLLILPTPDYWKFVQFGVLIWSAISTWLSRKKLQEFEDEVTR